MNLYKIEKIGRRRFFGRRSNLVRFFELATGNKRYVRDLILHETKDENLEENRGSFEMIGSMLIGELEEKTNNRYKNVDDFEGYCNAIDIDYVSEDVIFTGLLYKLNTAEFNKVTRSQKGRGTDFNQNIVEYIVNTCYIATSGNCCIKFNNNLTGNEYTNEFLAFIRTEQRRSNVMATARFQHFCKKHEIKIGR